MIHPLQCTHRFGPSVPRVLGTALLTLLGVIGNTPSCPARVVINEIFYHAPDDREDLQFIELHNTATEPVELGGWTFSQGIRFTFPSNARIEPRGFLVLCRNAARFQEFYEAPVAGTFQGALSRKGERLELVDAQGHTADSAKFKDAAPWPTGTDGESGSLERICPEASGDDPANWIASPLSADRRKPGGTPGRANAGYAPQLPPVITKVIFSSEFPVANQPVSVEAELRDPSPGIRLSVLYRSAGPGFERPETSLPMQPQSDRRFSAVLPGQAAGQLLRFRVLAMDEAGLKRFYPAETEPRPALSAYFPEPTPAGSIPYAWILRTDEAEWKAARPQSVNNGPGQGFRGFGPPGGFVGGPPDDGDEEARREARAQLERGLDLSGAWYQLTAIGPAALSPGYEQIRTTFLEQLAAGRNRIETTLAKGTIVDLTQRLPGVVERFRSETLEAVRSALPEAPGRMLAEWIENQKSGPVAAAALITSRADLEGAWMAASLQAPAPSPEKLAAQRQILLKLDGERRILIEEVASGRDRASNFRDQRERADSLRESIHAALNPTLTEGQQATLEAWRKGPREIAVGLRSADPVRRGPLGAGGFAGPPGRGGPPGGFRGFGGSRPGAATRSTASHRSAFIYFDPATGRHQLFDFVRIPERKGGSKLQFTKGRLLEGMSEINLIFEGDMPALVEPLAYEVYRRAGMPAPRSHHVRLWQDGRPGGYVALVEQPNKAFLRSHQIRDDGNLYKLLWFGGDVVGQHAKRTNRHSDHADVVSLIESLQNSEGDKQWELIRSRFDVEEVATYFAVNAVLSHWDGFFNNYFAYHDIAGSGKWSMYPWDQDNTWGVIGMFGGDAIFHEMPLTFGMNGDNGPGGFGGGWWRPPGFFSGPLLANRQFRKVFLLRVREILDTVYRPEVFDPILDSLQQQLLPEARIRADSMQGNPARAEEELRAAIDRCRQHLRLRRDFLLGQEELVKAAALTRSGLGLDPAPKPATGRPLVR